MLSFLLYVIMHGHVGVATNFSAYGDAGNPSPFAACLRRNMKDSDVVVASRTLPCNSRVFIYLPRTGKSIVATVGDRGPVHADIDLNVATAKKLRANGMERVIMVKVP